MGIYYSQHDVPSDEVLINRHNRLVLGEFKSRNYDIAKLAVREPGLVTGVKRKLTRYLKAIYPLTPYQQPDEKPDEDTVVNTVDIITRNNKHPSFLWHTTAANISTSVKYGFGYASSLVGEVNKKLGQYHLDTFEDIDQGFVSHRYFVKKALLDLYQSRLEGLAQVESLINTQATPKQITAALDEYEKKIVVLDAQLMSMRDGLGVNKISLDTFFTPVKNGFTQEIQRIKDYQEKVVKGMGTRSILKFVSDQMFYALNELASLNENITFTREFGFKKIALNRGRLHKYIKQAKAMAAFDHVVDYHNKVKASHHGQFVCQNENERVSFDSSQYALTQREQQRALLAIGFIEGVNVIKRTHSTNFVIRNNDNVGGVPLRIVSSIAWTVDKNPVQRAFRWLGLFVWRSAFNVLGLPLAVLTQPLKWLGFPRASQFFDGQATLGLLPNSPAKLNGLDMRRHAHKAYSLRSYTSDALYFVGDHFIDALKGVGELIVRPFTGLVHDVQNDYADVLARSPLVDVLSAAKAEIAVILENSHQRLRALALESQDYAINSLVDRSLLSSEMVAVPEYFLNDGSRNAVLQNEVDFDRSSQETNRTIMRKLYRNAQKYDPETLPLKVHAEVKEIINIVSKTISNPASRGLSGKAYDELQEELIAIGNISTKLNVDILPVANFFLTHRANLPYLSEKTKHRLMQHIEKHFDYAQAASFQRCLYPRKPHKIPRAFLNALSAYVQFGLRVTLSIPVSLLTLSYRPFANACYGLVMQAVKDVGSIYRVVQQAFKLAERIVSGLVGVVSDIVVNMIFARTEALFFNQHYISAAAKAVTTFFDRAHERVRQFISVPGDYATKLVTAPDLEDTCSRIGQSYMIMCNRLIAVDKKSEESSAALSVSFPSTTVQPNSSTKIDFADRERSNNASANGSTPVYNADEDILRKYQDALSDLSHSLEDAKSYSNVDVIDGRSRATQAVRKI